jgi:protein-S-isoprenylcysteine O-methyltransferase Ste14
MFVVVSWLSLPFLANIGTSSPCFRIIAPFYGRAGFVLGLGLLAAGYAGTIWCYAAMGNTWRMGIKPTEKTALVKHGPYRFVRHPIYLFQILMLAGVVLLLPSALSLAVLLVHGVCVLAKTADEENYLRTVHGSEYEDYLSRSGKFLPKFRAKSGPKRAAASRGVAR